MATKKTWPFRTPISDPIKKVQASGKKLEDVYAMKLDENGVEHYYVQGKRNVYEQIQAFADEGDIEKILEKATLTGNINILGQVKAEYMDLTEMPTNLIDAKNRLIQAEQQFYNLPVNVRAEFNNSFNEYLAEVGTEKWIKAMGYGSEPNKEEPESDPVQKGEDE